MGNCYKVKKDHSSYLYVLNKIQQEKQLKSDNKTSVPSSSSYTNQKGILQLEESIIQENSIYIEQIEKEEEINLNNNEIDAQQQEFKNLACYIDILCGDLDEINSQNEKKLTKIEQFREKRQLFLNIDKSNGWKN